LALIAAPPIVRWRPVATQVEGEAEVWRELQPAPAENRGFAENGCYLFEKPHPHCLLHVDDEPLRDPPGGGQGAAACWMWEPGFFAGEVTAELHSGGETPSATFLLDVAPHPGKMGRDMFARMLDELWAADPTLVIGSEPATRAIGDLGPLEDPWLAFARLRRYAPEFLRAMASVRANPRHALRVRRDAAPLHHVRRTDRRTVAAILRTSAAALLVSGTTRSAVPTDTRLDVPAIDETLDSAANRCLLALVRALARRTRMLRDRLRHAVERERDSDTRTPLAARWPARRLFLDRLDAQLTRWLRQSPLSQATRADITAAGLTAIAADSLYARAWGRGWRALRHGVEQGELHERLWISPSWEIYERWCFLRLGRLLTTATPDWQWHRARHPDRWLGSCHDLRCELRLQPTFRSHPHIVEQTWSVSKQREPDLVLTLRRGDEACFIVLDAKYRTTRANVLDAMSSAHIYQDSLRLGSRRPEASLLLVPAPGGAPWLEQADFHRLHRVGVHILAPDGTDTLPDVIATTLHQWNAGPDA
jgi:hypothetical protein